MGKPLMHKARKRFGQNFLHDQQVIEQIINAVAPAAGQHLVEIGPGKGALTEYLLAHSEKLDVIELDRDLVPMLETRFGTRPHFAIYNEDALEFDFCQLSSGSRKLKVVGNLPYNISTPLIFHLLEQLPCINEMYFMLQKEVVERMAANPGSKTYGRLSVMVQFFCDTELLFIVPPTAFDPIPKVESAIVRLLPRTDVNPDINVNHLAMISKLAFAQRRKTLRNNLKGFMTAAEIEKCNIDPGRRAETLSVADFTALAMQYETAD